MTNKSIIITNPNVIDFFEKNEIYEPNSFFNVLIKQFVEKNEKIDNKIDDNNTKNEKILISKEELKIFYEEYKFFINQKITVTGIMKEAYRESQCNLNRVKFTNLDNFFTKHLNIKKPSFVCDICGIFTVSTKKGLITHKRKCSKTNGIKDYEDDDEDEEDEDYEEENKQLPQKQPEKIAESIQKIQQKTVIQPIQITQPISEPKQTVQPTQTIPTQQSVQIPQSAQLKQPVKPLQAFQSIMKK
jgi:hypothetical protein